MKVKLIAGQTMDETSHQEFFDKTRERIHQQMLSAVSHDLKTPLATIIGSLEIYMRMEEKLSLEKKITLIKSALGEAYRLDNFITNILDMAKLEGGIVKTKQERFDLTNVLQDAVTRLGPRADKGKITLHKKEDSSIVSTDPMLLGRAAGLLLDNALKHSGAKPVIDVEYGAVAGTGYIMVCDNGPGIPAGKEKDIFSKYTRFSKSDQQNAGTGLGLAICRQIMHTIGGEVTLANRAECGAAFTLRFPSSL